MQGLVSSRREPTAMLLLLVPMFSSTKRLRLKSALARQEGGEEDDKSVAGGIERGQQHYRVGTLVAGQVRGRMVSRMVRFGSS